jgi:drug/metabolite transporter (DMT)-like permease
VTGAASTAPRLWVGPLMMLGGAVAIGFAPIGLRLSEFGPQATAFWRFAFALPLLAIVIFATGGRIRAPGPLSLLAGLFFGLDIAFWHEALVETSVANATFLVNLGNASVGVIAWVVLKEKPARIWPVAIGVALLGALLLSRGADPGGSSTLYGDLLAMAAAAMVAMYLFFARLARRTETALNVLFWATVVELVVAGGATGVTGEDLLPPDAAWLLAPLFLAIVAHVTGQGLIIAGVGRTPTAVGGLLLLVQPVTGVLIAWPLFGETLSPLQMGGAALVLVGVWLAGRG